MPPSEHGSSGASRLWRWVCFSGALHMMIVFSVFIVPASTVRRPVSYPVYTVDLVGGAGFEGVLSAPSNPKVESPPRPSPTKNEPAPQPKGEETPVDDAELDDPVAEVPAPEELPAHVEPDPPQLTEKAPKPPPKAEDVVKPSVEAAPAKIAEKTATEKPKPKVEEKVRKPAKKKTVSSKKRVEKAKPKKAKPKKPSKAVKKRSVAEKTRRKTSTRNKVALQRLRERRIEAAVAKVKERAAAQAGAENNSLEQMARAGGTGRGRGAGVGDGTGDGGGVVRGLEFVIYRNRMLDQIKNSWTWMGKRNDLEVTVRFGVDSRGEVFGLQLVEASGDSSYDESVMRAVKRASPLPPPPGAYLRDFADVELTFRPRDLSG